MKMVSHARKGSARQVAASERHYNERPERVSGGLAADFRFDSESQGRGCRHRAVCRGRDPDAKQAAAEEVADLDLSSKTLSRGGH